VGGDNLCIESRILHAERAFGDASRTEACREILIGNESGDRKSKFLKTSAFLKFFFVAKSNAPERLDMLATSAIQIASLHAQREYLFIRRCYGECLRGP
jgi:hypothetical protein